MKFRCWVGMVILIWIVLIVLASQARASDHPYPRLHPIVRKAAYIIAGHPFRVRCDISDEGYLGSSDYGLTEVRLRPWICKEANFFADGYRPKPYTKPFFQLSLALAVVLHESIHQIGPPYTMTEGEVAELRECIKDVPPTFIWWNYCEDPRPDLEALTECRTIQTLWAFSMLLGAEEAYGRALGHAYMRHYKWNAAPGEQWPWSRYYKHPDCVDGGKLDMWPGFGDWPNS